MSSEDFESKLKVLYLESMKGDKASYEIFLELTSVLIKRYLLKLGGKYADVQSIEDLLQEVLITLHEKKHTYKPDRPLLPWVYAIARHRYIDYYRSRKRTPGMVEIDDSVPAQEEESEYSFEDIMGYLSPKQKEMLMMIKVEGSSYAEAAKAFSMSVPALKVAVHRMVKALKGKVDHE